MAEAAGTAETMEMAEMTDTATESKTIPPAVFQKRAGGNYHYQEPSLCSSIFARVWERKLELSSMVNIPMIAMRCLVHQ